MKKNNSAHELKCLAQRPGHFLGLSLGQLSSKVWATVACLKLQTPVLNALLGKKGNGKVSKNVLFAQNQGFDLQGISFFKILLNQRHYLPNQNVFQLWWKGIAYLWKKNLKHLLIENSFHSRLDWNTLEGGTKWYKRCKPSLLKDIILQRYYMCVEVQELFLLKWH